MERQPWREPRCVRPALPAASTLTFVPGQARRTRRRIADHAGCTGRSCKEIALGHYRKQRELPERGAGAWRLPVSAECGLALAAALPDTAYFPPLRRIR